MRSDGQLIDEILAACDDGQAIVSRGRETFERDPLLQRAAKNVLSEIGEGSKGLSDEVTGSIDLPWRQIKGIREKVVHDYHELDRDVLWSTLTTSLPELGAALRAWTSNSEP